MTTKNTPEGPERKGTGISSASLPESPASCRCETPTVRDVARVARQFELSGELVDAVPFGSGHINHTFAATYRTSRGDVRFIHQRVNRAVFPDPELVMENIVRTTDHLRNTLREEGADDLARRVLCLVPSRCGRLWHVDEEGQFWRTYSFVEEAISFNEAPDTGVAREAARAFGDFLRRMASCPGPRFRETLSGFHHTRRRFNALVEAIRRDPVNRARSAAAEIRFALAREHMVDHLMDLLEWGTLKERVTHNDTKINNVLLDRTTRRGLCVIDLDTVMPGLVLWDLGDLIRSATRPTPEDERDLERVTVQMPAFEAVVQGFLEGAGSVLGRSDRREMVFSGRLITLEIGLRFLADYLEGDRYFRIHREGHNLDRCRTQFRMLESMEAREDEMERLVEKACRELPEGEDLNDPGTGPAWRQR